MQDATFLFTDIEGSTRLWEEEPERMKVALAKHDAIARAAVEEHGGQVVKMTGDGVHAVFDDALEAVQAALALQHALHDAEATGGIALRVRCGLNAGPAEGRDGDFYGTSVNRAARLMAAAHGGQALLSQTVARRIDGRLPAEVALRDLGLARLRDLAAPEHVFQLVHPALRADFPALRSLEDAPNNLPNQITAFVGRERELAALGTAIAGNRLVTVVGMGGIGKTRLALQSAADRVDDFVDGAWFVDLAPLTDASRVAHAVAAVLGVREEDGESTHQAIARHVRTRRLLVILDNCEHVLSAAAEVARRMLEAAPGVKVVATSRESLQLTGELAFPLSSLAVPGPRAMGELSGAVQYDAVQLFVQRAQAARPDFELTAENVGEVAAICHRLDGIPLAIELAAARVRAMPVAQIATRLKDRFRLLATADATALPRQRTLQGLIDWSYDLLSSSEQQMLRQLSVFAGGWTLEAAERACDDGTPDGSLVLDLMSRLVEKSLVSLDPVAERYGMLETVRHYAASRLERSGDEVGARQRHARHFAEVVKAARAELDGPAQARALARLDAEHENALAALRWFRRPGGELSEALALCGFLKLYWMSRGLMELALRENREALEATPAGEKSLLRCRALYELGHTLSYMGRYEEARVALESSLAIARALGEAQALRALLQPLGIAASGQGDYARARRYLDELVSLMEATGDSRRLTGALTERAQLHRIEGEYARARPLYERALELSAVQGDRHTIALNRLNLAIIAILEADLVAARPLVVQALATAEELGSRRLLQSVYEVCAGLAAAAGDPGEAATFLGAAEHEARETGLRREPADEAFLAPLLARARASGSGADFEARVAEGSRLPGDAVKSRVRAWLSSLQDASLPSR